MNSEPLVELEVVEGLTGFDKSVIEAVLVPIQEKDGKYWLYVHDLELAIINSLGYEAELCTSETWPNFKPLVVNGFVVLRTLNQFRKNNFLKAQPSVN